MERHLRRILISALCAGCLAGSAGATPVDFESAVDFNGSGSDAGRTYLEVEGAWSYSHSVTFATEADEVLGAQLLLSHRGNDDHEKDSGKNNGSRPAELWFLFDGGGEKIGELDKSENHWVDQWFTLPPSLFAHFGARGGTLALILGSDSDESPLLWIDRSYLRGSYVPLNADSNSGQPQGDPPSPPVPQDRTAQSDDVPNPVPEPATLVLLGSGLIGVAGAARRYGFARGES